MTTFKEGDIVVVWSKSVCNSVKQYPAYGFVWEIVEEDHWVIVEFFVENNTGTNRFINIHSDEIYKVEP